MLMLIEELPLSFCLLDMSLTMLGKIESAWQNGIRSPFSLIASKINA